MWMFAGERFVSVGLKVCMSMSVQVHLINQTENDEAE